MKYTFVLRLVFPQTGSRCVGFNDRAFYFGIFIAFPFGDNIATGAQLVNVALRDFVNEPNLRILSLDGCSLSCFA